MLSNPICGKLALTRLNASFRYGCSLPPPREDPPIILDRRAFLYPTLLFFVLLLAKSGIAQPLSDDPTDAAGYTLTMPALANSNTGVPGTTACTGTANGLTASLTLAGATNTAASIVPAPPCGNFTAATRDVWVRIDMPATGDLRYRITVNGVGTAPVLSNGAIAAYTAPSAAGPFSLLGCAIGGNPATANFNNPAIEVACLPPGSKIYLRIWDELTPASTASFTVCVQRQNFTTVPIATVPDTPCSAALLTGTNQNFNNTFACSEGFPWNPSCGGYQGGDIWTRFVVPASGAVTITQAISTVTRVGMTVYTAPNCSSLEGFNEVACVNTTLTATPLTTTVRCLAPGSTIYIRSYSTDAAQANGPRFGIFTLSAANAAGSTGSLPNYSPCTATVISSFATSCPTNTSGTPGANLVCPSSGAPVPGCGVFSINSADAWYRFTGPTNGTIAIRVIGDLTSSPAFNPAVALYTTGASSCNGPLTLVDCDAKMGPGLGAYIVRTGLIPGQTYYIRIWGEGTPASPNAGQTGIFYLCVTNPIPPPGHCFYLIRMTNENIPGTQTMRVAIGTDTTDYVTTGSDASQLFLVALPSGVSVTFLYYNTSVIAPSTYGVAQLGGPEFWGGSVGGAVIGPTPPPASQYTLSPTCAPLARVPQDCIGGTTICTATASLSSSTIAPTGRFVDLTAANRGCLSDETNGGRWFLFRPTMDGEISFAIVGTTAATDDLDFAIWDAGLDDIVAENPPDSTNVHSRICSPQGPPIRCSSARVNGPTGLRSDMVGRPTEGTGGYSWVAPLTVQQGHVYILYVASVFQSTARNFQITWTRLVDASGNAAPGILDCAQLILPVEFLFIEAEALETVNEVRWATASERNSDHFVVERRSEYGEYEAIGLVAAAGYSVQRTDYRFVDKTPLQGRTYYRLKQMDMDDSHSYSQVVTVLRATKGTLVLYPNPTNDVLWVKVDAQGEDMLRVQVMDAVGRILREQRAESPKDGGAISIAVRDLAQGTYILHIDQGGQRWTERFVKQ
jgi:hypothetical protein